MKFFMIRSKTAPNRFLTWYATSCDSGMDGCSPEIDVSVCCNISPSDPPAVFADRTTAEKILSGINGYGGFYAPFIDEDERINTKDMEIVELVMKD